jgi:hypothetical protein
MPKFKITYYEEHLRTSMHTVEVRADDADEARDLWNHGEPETDDDDSPVDVPCEVEYDCFSFPDDPEIEFHKIELIPGSEEDDVETRGIPRDHPKICETW